MDRMLGPTGIALVGTAFLCLILVLSVSASEPYDLHSDIQGHQFDIKHNKSESETGQLKLAGDTISFPWASRHLSSLDQRHSELTPRPAPTREEIIMKGSRSAEQLQDLKSINAVKQRDIVLVNFLDVSITGKGQGRKEWPYECLDDNGLENIVDNAINSGRENCNYMDIDVSGVSVSAINTQEGGSAVATSNIIIKPVQVIVCPSEAEENSNEM